jgi:hypothetical protein
VTFPRGVKRQLLDDEIEACHRELRPAIVRLVTRDSQPMAASPERLTALLYALVEELIMAAAATNLMQGGNTGTDLAQTFLLALPAGIRVRTLQLRHAVDEMQDG